MYDKWRKFQSKKDLQSKKDIEELEKKLADKIVENHNKIQQEAGKFKYEDGGFNSGKLWNLKKHLFPNHRDPPTAMKDDEGNLVTDSEKINELAVQKLAVEILKNGPMKKGLEEMKTNK